MGSGQCTHIAVDVHIVAPVEALGGRLVAEHRLVCQSLAVGAAGIPACDEGVPLVLCPAESLQPLLPSSTPVSTTMLCMNDRGWPVPCLSLLTCGQASSYTPWGTHHQARLKPGSHKHSGCLDQRVPSGRSHLQHTSCRAWVVKQQSPSLVETMTLAADATLGCRPPSPQIMQSAGGQTGPPSLDIATTKNRLYTGCRPHSPAAQGGRSWGGGA